MKPFFFLIAMMMLCGAAQAAEVTIIGEVHDNPAHHRLQAEQVATLQPAAIVFEMLTSVQAGNVTDDTRKSFETLQKVLGWADSGWPDFAMYYPIFTAAPKARIYGAWVPGPGARKAMSRRLTQHFEVVSQTYGLETSLLPARQAAREALQMAAHCGKLPASALPGMVDMQRLRDAVLADAVVQALADTGGPVVVITGNGHARRDWGVPFMLAQTLPDVEIEVIGQTEDDAPLAGGFDRVISAPAVARPDPCEAFN